MIEMIFAALAALQPPAAEQIPGEVQLFGDWAVGCDNGWACEAISLASEDWSIGDGISITVRRAGGYRGDLRIGVRVYEEIEGDTLALHIDGRHAATLTDSGDDVRFEIDPGIARIVLPILANGTSASLHGPAGAHLGDISLRGSSAALRFIDDRQQRAGTRGAAVASGEQPSSTVQDAPAIPTYTAMPIAARAQDTAAEPSDAELAALRPTIECDYGEDEPLPSRAAVLSDAADLILISCSRGAYNFSDIAFVRRDGTLRPARFDRVFAWGDARDMPFLVNTHWNPQEGVLSTYAKGRGIGDCGTAERFVWDGAMFRLIERREMNQCRGSVHWITVWRANVRWMNP